MAATLKSICKKKKYLKSSQRKKKKFQVGEIKIQVGEIKFQVGEKKKKKIQVGEQKFRFANLPNFICLAENFVFPFFKNHNNFINQKKFHKL